MEVQTVTYEMEVPKEFKEVVDLFSAILGKVRSKADIGEYLSLIKKLTVATDGIGDIGEEMKSQYRDEAAGYLVHKLMGDLLPVKQIE